MASLARLVGNGLYSAGSAAAQGLARLAGYQAAQQSERIIRPLTRRSDSPADFPAAERDRAAALTEVRRPVAQRPSSVPADAMHESAARTDTAARQTLEEARVQLRRLSEDPTRIAKQQHFYLNFGEKRIKVPYRIRHNGVVTPSKLKILKAQAEQTRLILQALYSHFEDDEALNAVKKHKKLSILQDIKHYQVIASENTTGQAELKVIIEDSQGRVIKHTFKENITVQDAGVDKTVDLEEYVNQMTESVHTAAKDNEHFRRLSGFDFFQRMILAMGVIQHALEGPNPKLAPKMPGHIPPPPLHDDPTRQRSLLEHDRHMHQQQVLREQQNQRLLEQLQQSRVGQSPPGAFRPI